MRIAAALVAGPLAVWAVLLGGSAAAQVSPSLDVRTWRPSMDPSAGLILEPAATPGPWRFNVAAWAQYEQDPVVLRFTGGGAAIEPLDRRPIVDLVAGVGLGERAAIGLDLPFFVDQGGSPTSADSVVSGGSVPSTGLGDAALLAKATLVSNERKGVYVGPGLAITASVSIPTGSRRSFMGEGAFTESLSVLGDYALGVGALRASAGFVLRTQRRIWPAAYLGGVVFGNELPWALSISLRPKAFFPAADSGDRQTWEAGVHGSLPAGPVSPLGPGSAPLSPVLAAIDDRITVGAKRDAFVLVGGELGLDDAVAVPLARLVVAVGWAPRKHDRDGDGVDDEVDQCPDLPEDRDGIQDADGCPEDDADGDGIDDAHDACPLVAGAPSPEPRKNGCPQPKPKPLQPAAPRRPGEGKASDLPPRSATARTGQGI